LTCRGGDLPALRAGELVASSLFVSQRFGDTTRVMVGTINVIDLRASHPFLGGWGTDRFWIPAYDSAQTPRRHAFTVADAVSVAGQRGRRVPGVNP
jgi:hypothetical protein